MKILANIFYPNHCYLESFYKFTQIAKNNLYLTLTIAKINAFGERSIYASYYFWLFIFANPLDPVNDQIDYYNYGSTSDLCFYFFLDVLLV